MTSKLVTHNPNVIDLTFKEGKEFPLRKNTLNPKNDVDEG